MSIASPFPGFGWNCSWLCGADSSDSDDDVSHIRDGVAGLGVGHFPEVAPGVHVTEDYVREQESHEIAQIVVYPQKIEAIRNACYAALADSAPAPLLAPLAALIAQFAQHTPHLLYEKRCRHLTASLTTFGKSVAEISEIIRETGVLVLNSTCLAQSEEQTGILTQHLQRLPGMTALKVVGSSLHARLLFDALLPAQTAHLQQLEIDHAAVAAPDSDVTRAFSIKGLYAKAPLLTSMTVLLPSSFLTTTQVLCLPPTLDTLHLRNCTNTDRAISDLVSRSLPKGLDKPSWTVDPAKAKGDLNSGFIVTINTNNKKDTP